MKAPKPSKLSKPAASRDSPASRPVYSSERGRLCPTCGWPSSDCRCSKRFDEAVPDRPVAKLRLERAGRGGKTVTVIDGLPRNAEFLATLLGELQRALATGGSAGESSLELRGDQSARLRPLLAARGFVVKG